jgi:hydrogenase nickel incorporation protein HypA/HybF
VHELSLTQAVVEAVADKLGDTPVARVTLEIGRLSGVVVDSVRFCFPVVADGTMLAGAELVIIEPPGAARCRDCGREFELDDPILLCPGCGGANVAVERGDELRIRSVEVRRECVRPADAVQPS